MSVVTTVAPSPQIVVHTVTSTVQVIPAWVGQLQAVLQQLGTLALLVVPAGVASKLHDWLLNDRLGKQANVVLLFAYSVVLGFAGLYAAGQLDLTKVDFHNLEQVGAAIFAVLGAASARYAWTKAQEAKLLTAQPSAPAQF